MCPGGNLFQEAVSPRPRCGLKQQPSLAVKDLLWALPNPSSIITAPNSPLRDALEDDGGRRVISRAAAKAVTGGWKSDCGASAGGYTGRKAVGGWQQIKVEPDGPAP